MSLPVNINDPRDNTSAQNHEKDGYCGVVVYTDERRDFISATKPFFNDTQGINMNIDASSTGTPTGIHNGEDTTLWAATEPVGTKATFNNTDTAGALPIAGSQQIHWNNGNVADTIQFANSATFDSSNFSALSMQVLVDSDWSANDSIEVYGYNTASGEERGDRVALEDYITPGNFDVVQSATIPLSAMGLASETDIDSFRMQIAAREGAKSPIFYIDTIQLEANGSNNNTQVFKVEPDPGHVMYVTEVIFGISDTGTGGTAYAYDQIGGLAALANGITIQVQEDSEIAFSIVFRQLADLLEGGAEIENVIDDGTDTYVLMKVKLTTPRVLHAARGDFISVTIADDLSGLLRFRGFARGRQEKISA